MELIGDCDVCYPVGYQVILPQSFDLAVVEDQNFESKEEETGSPPPPIDVKGVSEMTEQLPFAHFDPIEAFHDGVETDPTMKYGRLLSSLVFFLKNSLSAWFFGFTGTATT